MNATDAFTRTLVLAPLPANKSSYDSLSLAFSSQKNHTLYSKKSDQWVGGMEGRWWLGGGGVTNWNSAKFILEQIANSMNV